MKELSVSEKKALQLTAEGYKNKDIAIQMQSNEKTISMYLRRVRKKLNIPLDKNTYFLVAKAKELEVI